MKGRTQSHWVRLFVVVCRWSRVSSEWDREAILPPRHGPLRDGRGHGEPGQARPPAIATIAGHERGARAGIKLLGGGPGANPGTEIRESARLQLTEAVTAGRLCLVIADSYPLREAATAHREIMAGHTTGKIVLVP